MLSQKTQQGERQYDRFEILQNATLSVVIRRPGKPSAMAVTATPLDVSPSGVKLAAPESLGFGEQVELQFVGGNDIGIDFTVSADVRWIRQLDDKQAWVCGCSIENDCTDAWFQELAKAGYIERRGGNRIRSNVTARFKFGGTPELLTACILDYSSHGLCLAAAEPIGSDRPLVVMVQQDDDEPITLRARSRWEMAFESGYLVGCELYPADRDPQLPECSAADPMAKTHVMEQLLGEYADDRSEPNPDEELVLDTQPLLETIEALIDEVDSPAFHHTNDTVAIQPKTDTTATEPVPAFEPLPANEADETTPLVIEEEPTEEEAAKVKPELEKLDTHLIEPILAEPERAFHGEPATGEEAAETSLCERVADELSEPSELSREVQPAAKPKRRKRSLVRSIGLFLLIEVVLGGYFGAFYLNWDRSQPAIPDPTEAPRRYHYLQRVSEIVFYPAEKFESLFEATPTIHAP